MQCPLYNQIFRRSVERSNRQRMMLGLQEEAFHISRQEKCSRLELILSYSSENESLVSESASLYQTTYLRGKYKEEIRPILINSWKQLISGTGDTIYELAKAAKEVNIGMLVMDDGWFGKR